MTLCPMTLREANQFVASYHRHNDPTNGGRFAIGLQYGSELVGVAIVGNPISATYMDGYTAEVLRVCTRPDAPKGAVSKLYSACWRAWRAMGGHRIVTYTLQSESGASLRGAGWACVAEASVAKANWGKNKATMTRRWQPVYGQDKFRWERFIDINAQEDARG